ncbi:SpoIIE family protein phosphatase [Streptomyces yaanensis]|uniref:SpoIIE family protein phosphatase n=1 Tax=Streptomyces yaanensis TaxID=1142239 RepID=A0ABV7SDT2_9ACTN|nr:SpoIIE family protein phosphatase [Streptomyces sp. CGMCC 4.7035]WNB99303.1 SpoIIE family protein phosphatase [Streptomyces sp. CGMCC 4.7035]
MSGIDEPPGGAGSLDDALGAGLADTVRRTGASIGGLYLIDERRAALRLVALCGLPVEFSAPWQRLPLTAPVPVADAIREDRLVWVGSQADMALRYPRAAAVLPYRFALAAIALSGVRRCWGGIVLMWPADHPREATSRERDRITSSARRLTRLLDDAPRPPALPDQPRLVSLDTPRHPVQTGLAAADYLERLPEGALALDLEGRITFLTTTAAHLLGSSADRLLGTRPWQSLPWLDDPVYEDRYRTAVVSRAPQSFTALRPPDHRLTFQLHPDASGISVRITSYGEQTVPSLPSAGAQHTEVAPTGRLYQLVHLAAALAETVTVRDVVDLVAEQILPAFSAQGLMLSVADAGRLTITGHHGYPPEVVERVDGLSLDTDLTPAGQVLDSGTPAFFSSPAELAVSHPGATRITDKQAWAFLPLIITGRPVGCCVLSYDQPHTFTADERAVLTSLAGLIAQALDRARLYDAQHHLVHGLQQALLPRALPTVAGLDVAARYLPASHGFDVGGDFYDLLRLDDTAAGAVIGDVEGHNIAAAALMGQVRTAIHAHAAAGAPPDEVLARTNRLLTDLESDLLVSCLYAHLDLARHEVTLATAGHVPPLLRLAPHHARVLDIEPGPLLGIDTNARYPVTAVPMPADATLALYTDGLVEVAGGDSTQITADLVQHLADADDQDLEDLIDRLVHRAWPTGRHTDDIAVLLLRAKGTQSGTSRSA